MGMGKKRKVYKVLVGNPNGKIPFERPRHRWEEEIRMDLKETGWEVWSEFSLLRIGTGGRL
jgi:hypothetical protein